MEYDDVQHDFSSVDDCKIFLFHKVGSKSRHKQESRSSQLCVGKFLDEAFGNRFSDSMPGGFRDLVEGLRRGQLSDTEKHPQHWNLVRILSVRDLSPMKIEEGLLPNMLSKLQPLDRLLGCSWIALLAKIILFLMHDIT
jgi:hypothetical protein